MLSYLVHKRKHIYHLRVRVPESLQPFLFKNELHFTLKTGNRRLANRKAKELAQRLHNVFSMLAPWPSDDSNESNLKNTPNDVNLKKSSTKSEGTLSMDREQINKIIRDFVQGKLDEFDIELAMAGPGNPGKLDSRLQDYDAAADHLWRDYTQGRHVHVEGEMVNQILKKMGITLDEQGYQTLCRELLKAEIRTLEANRSKLVCNLEGTDHDSIMKDLNVPAVSNGTPKASNGEGLGGADAPVSPKLADLVSDFKNMKIKSKKWSESTLMNHEAKMNFMLEALGGDRPVDEITVTDMRELASKLSKNLDVNTQRTYLNFIKSAFSYAEDNEYIVKNPMIAGLVPPRKLNTRGQRLPFDTEDLNRVFQPDIYLEWSEGQPSRFWLPLLALYTGCRLEEMASLYCEHVQQIGDRWCILVNDDYDRTIKNQNAIRTVPLHPVLVDGFKFQDYVSRVKAKRVFPELKMVNFKYGHMSSKAFGYYLRKKVKIKDTKKTFHSFRHNVSDHLYQKMVQESLIEELTGRAGKTETRKRYAKGYRVPTLYEECILKLEYKAETGVLKELLERSGTW